MFSYGKLLSLFLIILGLNANLHAEEKLQQGIYFAKKTYTPVPLPKFDQTRSQLPAPIFDENPLYIDMYWKAWEIAFRNFHEPEKGSGFVTQFIDAAFSDNIFQWDTCFMTMFCNTGYPLVPGIGSLDNFYCKQYEDGEIAREIVRATGENFPDWVDTKRRGLHSRVGGYLIQYIGREAPQPPPLLELDNLNHPIFAWAEWEHLKATGDRSRVPLIYEPLLHYYRALKKYLLQGNGLYITDWASMDNSPRVPLIGPGGTCVDISAEMVMFADQMAQFADILGKKNEAASFRADAMQVSKAINEKMWDPQQKFYYDLKTDGTPTGIKTIAAFWTLVAGVASKDQADALVAELNNPGTFKRLHRVPTLAADQKDYDPKGGYWCGSVWAPTNTMVIRGLERYGQNDLARELAVQHVDQMAKVFKETGTIWENYAADATAPGVFHGVTAGRDFVGWSGIGPILYLLEFDIGLKPDALANRLIWNITSTQRCGCERYRFNGHVVTLIADPAKNNLAVNSDGDFELVVKRDGKTRIFPVHQGENRFDL